jgi:transposase-like protein
MGKGRKPLAAGHVDGLSGSELAKLRLSLILQAMLGEVTVAEACEQLGIGESRFHAMRNRWLQEALELLEPRPIGRPPKPAASASTDQIAQLEADNRLLQHQLQAAGVRDRIAEILKPTTPSADEARGKNRMVATTSHHHHHRRRRRRRLPSRPHR